MKKILAIINICIFCQFSSYAQSEGERKITKGSVITYSILEGKQNYQLKVTVSEWNPKGNIKVQWQTTGAKPQKGTSTFKYDALLYGRSIKVKLKPGNELLKDYETRFFAGYPPFDDMYNDYLDADVKIDDKNIHLLYDDYEFQTDILCNNVSVKLNKVEGYVGTGDTSISIDYYEYTSEVILMGYYWQKGFSMTLTSVDNPGVKSIAKPITKEDKIVKDLLATAAPKEVKLTKMPAAKFVKVRSKYPLLATIEDYDPTKGGVVKKPITETYEYRINSNNPNPPSLVDCLTADLRIIYNQSTNFGIYGLDPVTTKSFPEAAAKKLLDVYLNYDYMKIPGSRAWSNWSFVRSLTEEQRIKLAKNLEGYIAEYGFSE